MFEVSDVTYEFVKWQLRDMIAEFLDDPDGICGNDWIEIVAMYKQLSHVANDLGMNFWVIVNEEERTEYEIDRLKKFLEKGGIDVTCHTYHYDI